MHISTNSKVISILFVSIVFKYSTCVETKLWKINEPNRLDCEFDISDDELNATWYRDNEPLDGHINYNTTTNLNISTIHFKNVSIDDDQIEFSCHYSGNKVCAFKIYLYDDPENYKGKIIFEIDDTFYDQLMLNSSSHHNRNVSLKLQDPYNYKIKITYMFEALPLSQLFIDGNLVSSESCESSIGLKCLKTTIYNNTKDLYDICPPERLNYLFSYGYGNATEYQSLNLSLISFNTGVLLEYAPLIEVTNIPSEYDVKENLEPKCSIKCFRLGQAWTFYWFIEEIWNNDVTIQIKHKDPSDHPSYMPFSTLENLNISNNFDKIKFVCSVKNGVFDGSSYSIDAFTMKKKQGSNSTSTNGSGINLPLGAIIGIAVGIFTVFFILVFVVRYVVLPHFYFINKRI